MEDLGEVGVLPHPVAVAADVDDMTVGGGPGSGKAVVVTSLHGPSCSIHESLIGERRVSGYNSSFPGQQLSGRRYEGKTAIL